MGIYIHRHIYLPQIIILRGIDRNLQYPTVFGASGRGTVLGHFRFCQQSDKIQDTRDNRVGLREHFQEVRGACVFSFLFYFLLFVFFGLFAWNWMKREGESVGGAWRRRREERQAKRKGLEQGGTEVLTAKLWLDQDLQLAILQNVQALHVEKYGWQKKMLIRKKSLIITYSPPSYMPLPSPVACLLQTGTLLPFSLPPPHPCTFWATRARHC